MDFADFIVRILIGVLTGVAVAYLTAKYALRRFYSEKWWEKKYELYSQLLEAIHVIKKHSHYFYEKLDLEEHGHPMAEEKSLSFKDEEELKSDNHNKLKLIKKISDLSPLILNNKCKVEIETYLAEEDRIIFLFHCNELSELEGYRDSYHNADNLYTQITAEAKKDLLAINAQSFIPNTLTPTWAKFKKIISFKIR